MSETGQFTFETTDKLDRKPFSEKLEKFLIVEHDFVEGSLVISLNAPFGAGKTTFLSMWKADLDKRRTSDLKIPKVITVNAWESDYCGDPLLSIVNGLIKSISTDESTKESKNAGKLREAAKDVGWFATGLANKLVSQWTGLDPVSAGELAENKNKGRQPKIPDFISLYDERTKALGKLKDALKEIFGGDFPKAFVFVDELDRCRPDYAVSYLETVKHVFDVHGLIFILAIDYEQLECSAKALFGANLKFSDYFRKFAQRTISLPELDEAKLQNLAGHYVGYYLERENKRISLMGDHHYRVQNIVELTGALKMLPRQIQEAFRIIGHTLVANRPEQKGQLYWCIGLGVILMSVLKVAKNDIYNKIGNSEISHREVGKFLIDLFGREKAFWWFRIYITGSRRQEGKNPVDLEKLLKDLEFIGKDGTFDSDQQLYESARGWGRNFQDRDRWRQIHQNIETATTF